MGGKNYRLGNTYGLIWYKRKYGIIPVMGLHPRMRMKKTLNWLEMERKEKVRNINPN